MKWSIFKLLLAGGMAGMTLLPLCAQNDSIAPAVKERRWDKREHLRYDERWERLKPTHLKWQYAGGMGLNSVGVGWDYDAAVNLENETTVEFRIFRGTLRYTTFMAALELVHEICRFAIQLDDKRMEALSWSEFVSLIPPDKEVLIEYLKAKRLYVNETVYESEDM